LITAFAFLGDNSQAQFLALGLFVSWFPVLIICSIVDRNPVASDDIRRKINKLVDLVCTSLQDPETRDDFINSFKGMPDTQQMAYWVNKISLLAPLIKGDFFTGFAGQARTRFHYGAAHAILIDIEKAYVHKHGRGWLSRDEHAARSSLVLGQVDHGFVWFDGRQLWQIINSVMIVIGTSSGAFIIVYFTPTVGLGCRTGGFMIFVIIAFTLLVSELFVWALTSPIRKKEVNLLVQQRSRNSTDSVIGELKKVTFPGLAESKATLSWFLTSVGNLAVSVAVFPSKIIPMKQRKARIRRVENAVRRHFASLQNLTTRQWTERSFFTPIEFINMVWLCYMIMAQTIGAFVNCECQTSKWGPGGGYLDFKQWSHTDSSETAKFWTIGTVISCFFMGIGMLYVVIEWCLQSHLSTEDYKSAMNGLRRVRRFRRFTFWLRYPASWVVISVNSVAKALKLRKSRKHKALVWSRKSRHRPGSSLGAVGAGNKLHSSSVIDARNGRVDEDEEKVRPAESPSESV
jgi:hypothetical protein